MQQEREELHFMNVTSSSLLKHMLCPLNILPISQYKTLAPIFPSRLCWACLYFGNDTQASPHLLLTCLSRGDITMITFHRKAYRAFPDGLLTNEALRSIVVNAGIPCTEASVLNVEILGSSPIVLNLWQILPHFSPLLVYHLLSKATNISKPF